MSQKETWRTRKYWSKTGGLLIEEFLAVNGSKTIGKRPLDGIIVLNENLVSIMETFMILKEKM